MIIQPPLYGPRNIYRSTYYYGTPNVAFSAAAQTNNTNRCCPFWVSPDKDEIFDRIATEVTVISSPTTATVRLGIYNDDGTGYPGTTVVDAGTVTVGTVGVREITFGAAQTLTANTLYWLFCALTGATTTAPTMRLLSGAQGFYPIGADVATTINMTHWGAANAGTNTMTSPFAAGATPTNGPRVLLRHQ
jgi:hypothetical protein